MRRRDPRHRWADLIWPADEVTEQAAALAEQWRREAEAERRALAETLTAPGQWVTAAAQPTPAQAARGGGG